MSALYAILLLGSVSVPFALSFDKKLAFYKQWNHFIPSLLMVAVVYIFFDYLLTGYGVWGFNPRYHASWVWLRLPIEEWLFFIAIPYAAVFLHDAIVCYYSQLKLGRRLTKALTRALILFAIAMVLFNSGKIYTVYIFIKVIVVLLWSCYDKTETMNRFYITFLVVLVPFVMVNGILTGSFIDEPVVWYNDEENLGIRFMTIPVEDFFYAFSLIAFVLLLRIQLRKGWHKTGYR